MAPSPFSPSVLLESLRAHLIPSAITLKRDNAVDLLGCGDINCPTAVVNDTSEPNCIVSNDALVSVGIAPHAVALPNSNDSLTLTIGRHQRSDAWEEVRNSFYLGFPGDNGKMSNLVDSFDYRACALFVEFYGTSIGYNYDGGGMSRNGDCGPVLGDRCMDRVLKKAAEWDARTSCMHLAEVLQRTINSTKGNSGCSFPVSSVSMQGVPIIGPGSPLPLSELELEEGNCSPTVPGDYRIAKLGWEQHFALHYSADDTDGFTPIVSVVHDRKDNSVTVQLTCIRPLDEYAHVVPDHVPLPNEGENGERGGNSRAEDDGRGGKGGAVRPGMSLKTALLAFGVTVLALCG